MQGIAWAVFDREGESQNSLGRRPLEELAHDRRAGRARARATRSIRGLVIISGKEKGFIVGADVREFEQTHDRARRSSRASRRSTRYLDRIERLPVPVVCCIHGFCLGGGLELALACHWRIATRDDATRIGFPEVKLGIFPGFNGTARSIRQAGALCRHAADADGLDASAPPPRAAWASSTSWSPARCNLPWAARKAIERKRKSKPAGGCASDARCAMWPARGLLAKQAARRDGQEGARGALSRAVPPDRSVRDATAATSRR